MINSQVVSISERKKAPKQIKVALRSVPTACFNFNIKNSSLVFAQKDQFQLKQKYVTASFDKFLNQGAQISKEILIMFVPLGQMVKTDSFKMWKWLALQANQSESKNNLVWAKYLNYLSTSGERTDFVAFAQTLSDPDYSLLILTEEAFQSSFEYRDVITHEIYHLLVPEHKHSSVSISEGKADTFSALNMNIVDYQTKYIRAKFEFSDQLRFAQKTPSVQDDVCNLFEDYPFLAFCELIVPSIIGNLNNSNLKETLEITQFVWEQIIKPSGALEALEKFVDCLEFCLKHKLPIDVLVKDKNIPKCFKYWSNIYVQENLKPTAKNAHTGINPFLTDNQKNWNVQLENCLNTIQKLTHNFVKQLNCIQTNISEQHLIEDKNVLQSNAKRF